MDTNIDLSPNLATSSQKPKRILPFKCDKCEYSVRYRCQLKNHAKVHLDLKPLACPIPGCTYTTKWKSSLVNHKQVHEDETTVWYKCGKCDFKTKYKYVLEKRHARLHSEGPIPRRYNCDVCEYGIDSRPRFLEHRKNHNVDVKRLTCKYKGCGYTARWKCNMSQHKKRYHATKIVWYECDQCNYRTQIKTSLQRHAGIHREERSFSCPYPGCGFRTRTAALIQKHQRRLHGLRANGQVCKKILTLKTYHCTHSDCKFSSNESGNFNNHLKTHDPNRKRNFKCPLCSKSFFDAGCLKVHVSCHTFEKSFLCSFPNCDFEATCLSNVKKHELVHSILKMFNCTFKGCQKKFKTASYLRKHLQCHDPVGRPNYTCNLCSLEFLTRSGLHNHIIVHTNEKPYKCSNCAYSTAKSFEFKRHQCSALVVATEYRDRDKQHSGPKKLRLFL